MEFFNRTGKMAIGTRLRLLSERITSEAGEIYQLYGNDFQPKWFPVFYWLHLSGPATITQIAQQIGHSHPSVSKIVGELIKKGYLEEVKTDRDKRRNVVQLSPTGQKVILNMSEQLEDVGAAVKEIMSATNHDIWKALEEWEHLLDQHSLLNRVKAIRKKRTALQVEIIDYTPEYKKAFHDLNEAWIQQYFVMEPSDYKSLDDPEGYILSKGGHIFIAIYQGQPVGVCGMIKMNDPDYDFELAKMAVSPLAQGKSIGWLLGMAIIKKARAMGGKKLYLESNTKLKPAINLYYKLGFTRVVGRPSPYERCNIQMELAL